MRPLPRRGVILHRADS